MGFRVFQNYGCLFLRGGGGGVPIIRLENILGSMLGSPYFGKHPKP